MTSTTPDATRHAGAPDAVPAAVTGQADEAALAAALRAGVEVREVEDMAALREVSALLVSVWGWTEEGAPLPSEVMRGLVHAGGCVTAAFDQSGVLVGAAALAVAAPCGTTYSLIAAVGPGGNDRGIGQAVKLQQRAWALRHGYRAMVWTFDPLVSRNARFNLTKLGAVVQEYAHSFYGRMADEINGSGEADRLVVHWQLDSHRATDGSGRSRQPDGPDDAAHRLADGPDGAPAIAEDRAGLWLRVPHDIVGLRREAPRQAEQWRLAVRDAFVMAFDRGLAATHVTRNGWYLLTPRSEQ